MGIKILGCGSYLPGHPISNKSLENAFGADSEWIERRTGIKARHYASADQATSDLCVAAAEKAIAASNISKNEIDMIIVGTFTPDYWCPSTASIVQHKLGISAAAFDIQAACAGFIYALVTGAQYVSTGNSKCALIIGADCVSRAVAPDESQMTPLFGDGAGAVIITKGNDDQGLEIYQLGSDGSGLAWLQQPAGGSAQPLTAELLDQKKHFLQMDGRKVFKWAVNILIESTAQLLKDAGLRSTDISRFFFHQANQRILDAAIDHLGLNANQVHTTLEYSGNTSAASIPICLTDAFLNKQVEAGDRIVIAGFGAGLTWGSAIVRL